MLLTTMAPKSLGPRIAALREQRGLTQEALAMKAKVNRVYLARIETNTRVPSLPMLERIAKALRVPLGALVK